MDDDEAAAADDDDNDNDDDEVVEVDKTAAAEAGVTSSAGRTGRNDVSTQTTNSPTTKRLEMREI